MSPACTSQRENQEQEQLRGKTEQYLGLEHFMSFTFVSEMKRKSKYLQFQFPFSASLLSFKDPLPSQSPATVPSLL